MLTFFLKLTNVCVACFTKPRFYPYHPTQDAPCSEHNDSIRVVKCVSDSCKDAEFSTQRTCQGFLIKRGTDSANRRLILQAQTSILLQTTTLWATLHRMFRALLRPPPTAHTHKQTFAGGSNLGLWPFEHVQFLSLVDHEMNSCVSCAYLFVHTLCIWGTGKSDVISTKKEPQVHQQNFIDG